MHKAVEKDVDYHLEKALEHFEQALDLSVKAASENKAMQKEVATKMGSFTSEIFHSVREKGKENRMNIMKWFTLPRF
jgi:vacuolar-type H+-ATPase subunit H